MDFKKIFTSKIGIAAIFVVITVLAVLGFSVICKRGGSYMFRDKRGNTKVEAVVDKDVIDVEDSVLIYDRYADGKVHEYGYSPSVNRYYKYNDLEYHFVVNGKTIFVNGLEIFRTDNEIMKVYLVNDIVAVVYNYYDLKIVDMSGNVLKEITKTYDFSVNGVEFNTEVDNHIVRDDEIYELHNYDKISFSYLGEGKFSDYKVIGKGSTIATTPNECVNDKDYCLLYDKNNIKIEYSSYNDRHNWGTIITVNDKAVTLNGYRLKEIKFTNDNYLYISGESGTGNGLLGDFLIADLNGNVITTVDEKTLSDIHLYNYFTSFESNKIIYDAVQEGSDVEYGCKRMLEIDEGPLVVKSYDDVVYVKNEYDYIGNGKVSRVNHFEKTFGNYMKELTGYDNCQDAINNIDSWKSKDNIYNFYK